LGPSTLPLPVMEFLTERARTLRERSQKLHMEALDLENEKYKLLKLAQSHGVEKAEIYIGDSDAEAVVKDLLDLKVEIASQYNEDGEEIEGDPEYRETTFFSEDCLYELLGKDKARTVLGMMRCVVQKIAPNQVERL
jgi:hypothetical protein